MKLEIITGKKWEKHNHEIRQYATKEILGQWRNQRGNQKITQNKWRYKNNFTEFRRLDSLLIVTVFWGSLVAP